MRVTIRIAAVVSCLLSHSLLSAQPRTKVVPSRDYITERLADLRKINTPEGIEALEAVDIGGSKQWLSIRGLNRANPVLLMIHGGPGSPMMPLSWAFQAPWEDFFTVVQWDQRGAGKSYTTSHPPDLKASLTVDRMCLDAEEVVAYLRKRLQQDKIFVMGFSWGTHVGIHVAKTHPEWLYGYVGVGQSTGRDSEKYLYNRLLQLARKANNEQALQELQAIAPYPVTDDPDFNRKIGLTRKWARVFDGGWYGRKDFNLFYALQDWAPEYTQADVEAQSAVYGAATSLVRDIQRDDLTKLGPRFECPVIFLMGRYDLHTPYEKAKEYFAFIRAPNKKFVTFERSAHFMMFEEPGRFLMTLVNDVLPLAGRPVEFKVVQ